MSKLILRVLLFFFILSSYSHASCTVLSLFKSTVNPGNMVVQRDAPVGTVLGTAQSGTTSSYIADCRSGGYIYYGMSYNGGRTTSMSNVYATNLAGVGVEMVSAGGHYYTNPAGSSYRQGEYEYYTVPATVTFVKTGPITSGVLSTGLIAYNSVDSGGHYFEVNMGTGSVTQLACSITTPNLTFPIGEVLASDFGSSVGITPAKAQNTQNLGLNCDASANINVSLTGTQNPDVGTTSVLALTGQGSPGVAKGVGVQIVYAGSPLVLNNRIVLKRSSGGQETFPITARYYQTRTSVTTGSADSSATLNLTYQ